MKYIQQIEQIQNRFSLETEQHPNWSCAKLCFDKPELLLITQDDDWTTEDYKAFYKDLKKGEILYDFGSGAWREKIKGEFVYNMFEKPLIQN